MSSSLHTDPLLSSLCSNCRMNTPKYTCPGCSRRTCSLACVKQHKARVPCSGVRGVQNLSLKELYTVKGINNDYNFITRIERGIERAERIVIHEKGLIPKRSDREPISTAERERKRRRIMERDIEYNILDPDHAAIHKEHLARKVAGAVQRSGVIVKKAPMGMQRNKDNHTCLSFKRKRLNWQIEWITDDGTRTLDKVAETMPLGEGYDQGLHQRARAVMTTTERNATKKRKEKEIHRDRNAKRRKLDEGLSTGSSYLQNPKTSRWDVQSSDCILPARIMELPTEQPEQLPSSRSPHYFYLLRPFTPSSRPKVLIPLDSSKPLSHLLRGQVVFEFPTIYVSKNKPRDMPKSFIMEKDFLSIGHRDKGKAKGNGLVEYSDSDSDPDAGSESESEANVNLAEDPDSGSQSEKDEEVSSTDEDEGGATSWSESSEEDSDEDVDTAMV